MKIIILPPKNILLRSITRNRLETRPLKALFFLKTSRTTPSEKKLFLERERKFLWTEFLQGPKIWNFVSFCNN